MNDPTILRHRDLGPLHDIMLRACPPDVDGIKSINILAECMNRSHNALFQAIRKGRLTPALALEIVKVSQERVSIDELHTYVYNV